MKVIFVTQALSIGGIEVLALRIAEAFGKAGHQVILYDFNPDRRSASLVAHYDTKYFQLAALSLRPAMEKALWKAHALLFRLGLYKEFRPRVIERHFARTLANEQPDVVCSLSFHQDYLTCLHAAPLKIPVVISMHGTYEYAAPEWPSRARFIYDHVRAIIYAADKNMAWYQAQPYYNPALLISKIYTGIDLDSPVPHSLTRASLGLSQHSFIYVLVARGIREKGWQEALDAFRLIRQRYSQAALLLIGEGQYLTTLRAEYEDDAGVIFYGSHPNPIELVSLANVGLLPSYFSIESLPSTIIEYLRCSLPVVASDIGEIPEMLTLPSGEVAGAILSRLGDDKGVSITQLSQAMEQLLTDSAYYHAAVSYATQAIKRFDLQECVARYTRVLVHAQQS